MFSWLSFFCVLAASLSSLGLGLDVGMISSTAGGAFGAYGCAAIADPFGRVWGLRSGAVIAIIGIALQAGAVHVAMLIIGRLICGFGAAQLLAVFPVYASEVAPPQIRGALGGFQMLMIEAAIFIATGAGYGFGVNYTSNAQWRGPLAVQAVPLALLIPVTFFLPESPRWLISKNQQDKALAILRRLHSGTPEGFVEGEYREIEDQLMAEKEAFKPTWMQIAKKPSWRKRVVLAAGIQIFSQLTGINCVQYYAASIYEKLGFSTFDALRLNLIYGAFGLIFAIFWVSVLDRMPRIKVLVIGELFMCAALLVQSVLSAVYAGKTHVNNNALNAQVSMFFVFNLFFISVGMLSWLIPPEMSPMCIRAKVNSVSVSVNNIAGLVIAEISPIALNAIGFKFFYVFVACDIVAALTYYFVYPETSKLTLEEMDIKFGDQIVNHVLQDQIQQSHRGKLPSFGGQHVGEEKQLDEPNKTEVYHYESTKV